jgi:hypothetical protein
VFNSVAALAARRAGLVIPVTNENYEIRSRGRPIMSLLATHQTGRDALAVLKVERAETIMVERTRPLCSTFAAFGEAQATAVLPRDSDVRPVSILASFNDPQSAAVAEHIGLNPASNEPV